MMDLDQVKERIHNMDLFETFGSKKEMGISGFAILRVPGGWVFNHYDSSCFVPYDTEFKPRADGFKRKSPVKSTTKKK